MEIGTLAELLGAAATIAATCAAFVVGIPALREYRRSEQRERIALATGVWGVLVNDPDTGMAALLLSNHSGVPIRDVRALVMINGEESRLPATGRDKTWHMLPPGDYIIRKGTKFVWDFPEPVAEACAYRPWSRSDKFRVNGLLFTDARGVRWRVRPDGTLVEVDALTDERVAVSAMS